MFYTRCQMYPNTKELHNTQTSNLYNDRMATMVQTKDCRGKMLIFMSLLIKCDIYCTITTTTLRSKQALGIASGMILVDSVHLG